MCLFFKQPAAYDEAMTSSSEFPAPVTSLQPGQALRMAVDAGFVLRVARGQACVTAAPAWLGERMFSAQTLVRQGEVHVVAQRGWIEVRALGAVQVEMAAPAPAAPGRAYSAWRRVWRLAGGA